MRQTTRPKTLAEVAAISGDAETLGFAIPEFLDEFHAEPLPERLEEEPRLLTAVLNDDGLADATLAAIADHLSRQYKLRPPSWIAGPGRILATPWFALKSHGGRMCMLIESPPAFRERNIFVSANALSRA
ncbi:MAG: hypothetical protein ABSE62_05510 [Chthoniobacteraceae bacterium]|jgi:hypothetical protein